MGLSLREIYCDNKNKQQFSPLKKRERKKNLNILRYYNETIQLITVLIPKILSDKNLIMILNL